MASSNSGREQNHHPSNIPFLQPFRTYNPGLSQASSLPQLAWQTSGPAGIAHHDHSQAYPPVMSLHGQAQANLEPPQVISFQQGSRQPLGPAGIAYQDHGQTYPLPVSLQGQGQANRELPQAISFPQGSRQALGPAGIAYQHNGEAYPPTISLQRHDQANGESNTSRSDPEFWRGEVRYRKGFLSLAIIGFNNLNNVHVINEAFRTYEDLIKHPDFGGSSVLFYQWIRKTGEPKFIHEDRGVGMWLIPNIVPNPTQYSRVAALIALTMQVLEDRWQIVGYGYDEIRGSVLVGGQLRPGELEFLNKDIFPESLARFGQPANALSLQASIDEDGAMQHQAVAGATPSDEEGEVSSGDTSVQDDEQA